MNQHLLQQRAGSVSVRSLYAEYEDRRTIAAPMNLRCRPFINVTLTRPAVIRLRQEATNNAVSRRERGFGDAMSDESISVRMRSLSSIVLQLQPRYRKCVHFRGGAYIEVENVRTTSLRTKGAYISGSDVRTRNSGAIANLLRLESPERHGGRSLQLAISAPEFGLGLSLGRVARGSVDRLTDVDDRSTPPPAYAAPPLSTGAKTAPLASNDAAD